MLQVVRGFRITLLVVLPRGDEPRSRSDVSFVIQIEVKGPDLSFLKLSINLCCNITCGVKENINRNGRQNWPQNFPTYIAPRRETSWRNNVEQSTLSSCMFTCKIDTLKILFVPLALYDYMIKNRLKLQISVNSAKLLKVILKPIVNELNN